MGNLSHVFRGNHLDSLKDFTTRADQLGIVEREPPAGAEPFFQRLMKEPFGIFGKVRKRSAVEDIHDILKNELSNEVQCDPFYQLWLSDMAEICIASCTIQGCDFISFWLGSERGCRRYHIDSVDLRMLVTYAGKGTEWIPDDAADRAAFANGEPNEKIVKDRSAIQYMKKWDIALFRGGPKGLLHRTPDAALDDLSILMRLDHSSFWEKLNNQTH